MMNPTNGTFETRGRWRVASLVVVAMLTGCTDGGGGDDPPVPDAGEICTADDECDNGIFCDGAERCSPGAPKAASDGCVPGEEVACGASERCGESEAGCVPDCDVIADQDDDGHATAECGGDDCDDSDPSRFPGNPEICDADGHDEDCNPETIGPDMDDDGYVSTACCYVAPTGATTCGGDCDDTKAGVHPEAPDGCGGGNEDCDSATDEEPSTAFYLDADGDGHGSGEPVLACSPPSSSYVARTGDCSDDLAADPRATEIRPGADEICNTTDDDCDGLIDERDPGQPGCDCLEPGMEEACGVPPSQAGIGQCVAGSRSCTDEGAWTSCVGTTGPEPETCDEVDNDCDGTTDEGVEVQWYPDCDRDGFGDANASAVVRCAAPTVATLCAGGVWRNNREDCDDSAASINPGNTELCDGYDTDCSDGGGRVELEDWDGDAFAAPNAPCTGGFPKTDCNDFSSSAHPGAGFATEPALCPDGHEMVTCSGTQLCTPVSAGCAGAIPLSVTAPLWDMNCDGTMEPELGPLICYDSEFDCPATTCPCSTYYRSTEYTWNIQCSTPRRFCGHVLERVSCRRDPYSCLCTNVRQFTGRLYTQGCR